MRLPGYANKRGVIIPHSETSQGGENVGVLWLPGRRRHVWKSVPGRSLQVKRKARFRRTRANLANTHSSAASSLPLDNSTNRGIHIKAQENGPCLSYELPL